MGRAGVDHVNQGQRHDVHDFVQVDVCHVAHDDAEVSAQLFQFVQRCDALRHGAYGLPGVALFE
jgi:hypothetical protein